MRPIFNKPIPITGGGFASKNLPSGWQNTRCRGRRGRLRRSRSTQSSPRRQWRRRGAAEEREEKGGSEPRASTTTGLKEDWEAATEEAFACEGWTSGGRRRLPGHGGSRERRRRRRRRPRMLGVDAGETEEKRPSGNRERRRRWLGLCGVEKETEEKEEAEVDGCDDELGSRDQRVDEDGDEAEGDGEECGKEEEEEEEGERDSGGDKVCRGSGNSITEEKGGGLYGDGRQGRKGDGRGWRKREEREKRQGGSPVEERERREEKPGLTASKGRSGGGRQRSASKNGDAGARRDNGGRVIFLFLFVCVCV